MLSDVRGSTPLGVCITYWFKLISSVVLLVQYGDNSNESFRQLALLAQLNADLCVAECNVLIKNKDYKPSEDATASDPPPTLKSITLKMVQCTETFML